MIRLVFLARVSVMEREEDLMFVGCTVGVEAGYFR